MQRRRIDYTRRDDNQTHIKRFEKKVATKKKKLETMNENILDFENCSRENNENSSKWLQSMKTATFRSKSSILARVLCDSTTITKIMNFSRLRHDISLEITRKILSRFWTWSLRNDYQKNETREQICVIELKFANVKVDRVLLRQTILKIIVKSNK